MKSARAVKQSRSRAPLSKAKSATLRVPKHSVHEAAITRQITILVHRFDRCKSSPGGDSLFGPSMALPLSSAADRLRAVVQCSLLFRVLRNASLRPGYENLRLNFALVLAHEPILF
jgi:hypothetical protein